MLPSVDPTAAPPRSRAQPEAEAVPAISPDATPT